MNYENPVRIRIEVNQVEDGKVYTGTALFDDVRFDYMLDFHVPMETLSKSALNGPELAKRVSVFASRGRNKLELTQDEIDLFVATVVPHTIGFYRDRETRAAQNGLPGYLLRKGFFVDGAEYQPFTIKRDPVVQGILNSRRSVPYEPLPDGDVVLYKLMKFY